MQPAIRTKKICLIDFGLLSKVNIAFSSNETLTNEEGAPSATKMTINWIHAITTTQLLLVLFAIR